MKVILESTDLNIFMPEGTLEFCSKRAGNPMSTELSETVPKSIDGLATCKLGSGHDCYMSGIFVYFDWNINKIIREQLLRYNFINVISSQSLMHCFEKFKKEGMISAEINSVDDLPLSFKYWITFTCNYRQLKTLYSQRHNHKRPEWQHFCKALELLPNSQWIIGEKKSTYYGEKEVYERIQKKVKSKTDYEDIVGLP